MPLLTELESEGATLRFEYAELYRAVKDLPASDLTREAILLAQAASIRLGFALENQQSAPAATPSVEEVLAALAHDPNLASSLLERLATADPDTAMEIALAVENPATQNQLLEQALPSYAKARPSDAIYLVYELFDPINPQINFRLGQTLLQALEADPSAAHVWFRGDTSHEQAAARLSGLLRHGNPSSPRSFPCWQSFLTPNSRPNKSRIRSTSSPVRMSAPPTPGSSSTSTERKPIELE